VSASHRRPTEAVSDMIGDTCLILYVEMELLQVGGPLLMALFCNFPCVCMNYRGL
jgi:hypothetical protein